MQHNKKEKNLYKSCQLPEIGSIIKAELRRQKRSVTWLSKKLNCTRRNIYDIFSRQYIDSELLYRICIILNVDFFKIYSDFLKTSNTSSEMGGA